MINIIMFVLSVFFFSFFLNFLLSLFSSLSKVTRKLIAKSFHFLLCFFQFYFYSEYRVKNQPNEINNKSITFFMDI